MLAISYFLWFIALSVLLYCPYATSANSVRVVSTFLNHTPSIWTETPDTTNTESPRFNAIAWTWYAQGYGAGVGRSPISFDFLKTIPPGSQVIRAKLSLYADLALGHDPQSGSNAWSLKRITSPWSPQNVTWNNQPSFGTDGLDFPQTTDPKQDYPDIDITQMAQYFVSNPQANFGLMFKLETEVEYRSVNFASTKSNDTSRFPRLEVTYSDGDIFLNGSYVELGIHSAGSLGSQNSAPQGFHANVGTNLGVVADHGRDGWNVGTPPFSGDYILPGTKIEGWAVEFNPLNNTSAVSCWNSGLLQKMGALPTQSMVSSSGNSVAATWGGTCSSGSHKLMVQQLVYFHKHDISATFAVTLVNVGSSVLRNIEYMRVIDPDQEQPFTGSYLTRNLVVHQPNVTNGKGLVTATGLTHSLFLGVATWNKRAVVSARANINTTDVNVDFPANSALADASVSVAYRFLSLAPGQSERFTFSYIFNNNSVDAVMNRMRQVTILSPVGVVSGATSIFTVGIDGTVPLSVTFRAEGNTLGTDTTVTNGIFSVPFNSTKYPEGIVTLYAIAQYANNTSTEVMGTVYVSNKGPSISFLKPAANSVIVERPSVNVSLSINSASPITSVTVVRSVEGMPDVVCGVRTSPNWQMSCSISDVPYNTTIIFTATAINSIGGMTSKQITIRRDQNECLINNGGCDPKTLCRNQILAPPVCGRCPSGHVGTGYTSCIPCPTACNKTIDASKWNSTCIGINRIFQLSTAARTDVTWSTTCPMHVFSSVSTHNTTLTLQNPLPGNCTVTLRSCNLTCTTNLSVESCVTTSTPRCGDGICNRAIGENCMTCESDCKPCCGNGICETNAPFNESCATCFRDCSTKLCCNQQSTMVTYGCTDKSAINYNKYATEYDGSCMYTAEGMSVIDVTQENVLLPKCSSLSYYIQRFVVNQSFPISKVELALKAKGDILAALVFKGQQSVLSNGECKYLDVVFTDDASEQFTPGDKQCGSCRSCVMPFVARKIPKTHLRRFQTLVSKGTWELRMCVRDESQGTFSRAQLRLQPSKPLAKCTVPKTVTLANTSLPISPYCASISVDYDLLDSVFKRPSCIYNVTSKSASAIQGCAIYEHLVNQARQNHTSRQIRFPRCTSSRNMKRDQHCANRCGPQVTRWLATEVLPSVDDNPIIKTLLENQEFKANLENSEANAGALTAFLRDFVSLYQPKEEGDPVKGAFNFGEDCYERELGNVSVCPSGDACRSTVGMLERCYRRDIVELIHLGYAAGVVGMDANWLRQHILRQIDVTINLDDPYMEGINIGSRLADPIYTDLYQQLNYEVMTSTIRSEEQCAPCGLRHDGQLEEDVSLNDLCQNPPGTASGNCADPHMTSVDKCYFDFHGIGEYTQVAVDKGATFLHQVRQVQWLTSKTVSVVDSWGVRYGKNGDIVSVMRNQADFATIDIYINKKKVALSVGCELPIKPSGYIKRSSSGEYSVEYSGGPAVRGSFYVYGSSNFSFWNTFVTLPSHFYGRTEGILGTWNGNKSDDLRLPNGTEIGVCGGTPYHIITQQFLRPWLIRQEDSLLIYEKGENTTTFFKPVEAAPYVPTFANPQAEQIARHVCAQTSMFDQCMFDISVTGDFTVAGATIGFTQTIQEIEQSLLPVQPVTPRKGLTWGKSNHDSSYGVDRIGCGSCEPYVGDTYCNTSLPLLCINVDGSWRPNYTYVGEHPNWAEGHIAITLPIKGTTLTSLAEANGQCQKNFGQGWRMAEFHDGLAANGMPFGEAWRSATKYRGGWAYFAYGNLPTATRFWLYINDQRANCWN